MYQFIAKYFVLFLLMPLSVLSLGGCSTLGVATGAAAVAGKAAAQEGGLSRAWTDARIQTEINDLWFRSDVDIFTKLDLTINQGRVLITGIVQNPEHRVEAVRLAWKPAGVKQVINEIRVSEGQGFTGFARDTWASTRLRTAITLDREVQSINYNIDTVQGIVYLMGVAQNRAELGRVIETARTIPDVKQVVSYVKIAGEEVPPEEINDQNKISQEPANNSTSITTDEISVTPSPQSPQEDGPIRLQRQSIEATKLDPIEWN